MLMPISRILYTGQMSCALVIYLGYMSPYTSSDTSAKADTILHTGRNFAVSPALFPERLILADALVSQRGRLCSHPFRRTAKTGVTCYLFCLYKQTKCVRTFLSIKDKILEERPTSMYIYNTRLFLFVNNPSCDVLEVQ